VPRIHAARRVLVASSLLATLACAVPALAQEPTPGEKLFLEGRQLMDQNKLDEACQRFAQSYELEKALGSLLNLANCEEKRGKLRTALGHWKKAADTAGDQQKNRLYALGRAAELEKRMPKVMVRVGATVADAEARVDGEAMPLGERVAVDPGDHEVVVTAGGRTERRTVTLIEGETQILDLFGAAPVSGGGEQGAGAGGGPPKSAPSDSNLGTWGWVSLAVGGAGAVGFGVTAGVFYAQCGEGFGAFDQRPCDQDAVVGVNLASGILAVAGVGLGITLLVIDAGEPSPVEVGAVALPGGGAALGLSGRF
jgi:hypothetical protein